MITISELYVYPIKSLGGISLTTAEVTDRGLKHDRRWMLVDENNRFLSQREYPVMALLRVEITDEGLRVSHKQINESIIVPFVPVNGQPCRVTVWDDTCGAVYVSDEADAWFNRMLSLNCRLVYMPEDSHRHTDTKYTSGEEITSFSDAYPLLLISKASLDDLNSRMAEPLPMERFRPNMVIDGTEPYLEDIMQGFEINGILFKGVKLCARCVMTTIDQQTAVKGKEPLKTLASYRLKNNKIMFGQNIIYIGRGIISVGDEANNIQFHTSERFMVSA
ncbi:MOSC domain-containing protein [Mucilaginibacter limnophilus]|uniref:MOSC domain-containing protein n=1 Tax=Mucilaginibacter limnophilus TaxID=1932778 RepID=A0A3S2UJG7_9SPHI|nr:MOSC N-terminal beta barrel domain-containing protein [Mucilaginibacter limnophilus]RVT97267.1 MOSC domain-containing protein [Mucilaginibacter limnophilus]